MELSFRHQVTYDTVGAASVSDVAHSLLASEQLIKEIGPILEGCVPDLKVERIIVSVRAITQESPLRELFFLSLVLAFQKDLEREVPAAIDELLGVTVPAEYNTLLTVLVLVIAFYGADYAYRQIVVRERSPRLKSMLDGLIAEAAASLNVPEDKVRKVLEERYGQTRLKQLANWTVNFFSPAKHDAGAKIVINETREIPSDVVADVPEQTQFDEQEPTEISEDFENVDIEVHAQDVDKAKAGWAGVIPSISDRRLRMQIYPPIKPEDIYTSSKIVGDVILISRQQPSGDYQPYMFHLVRLHEKK